MIQKIAFGMLGATLSLIGLYLAIRILRNFEESKDVAASMFYLKESANQFRTLAYVSLAYAIVAGLVVSGVIPDDKAYDLAVLGLFTAITYFLWNANRITSGAE